ncbi:MAG: hypothetical protein ACRDYU_07440 [Actinomycetes bacterium]
MAGWISTAPAAITALVATFRAAPGLGPDMVLDGPTVTDASIFEVVTVGYQDDERPIAVEAQTTREGPALVPNRERYSVYCAAAVLRGDTDIAAARARAYELLAAAATALAADKTLGGAVMSAQLGEHSLTQEMPDGALARVPFEVLVDAFTRTS